MSPGPAPFDKLSSSLSPRAALFADAFFFLSTSSTSFDKDSLPAVGVIGSKPSCDAVFFRKRIHFSPDLKSTSGGRAGFLDIKKVLRQLNPVDSVLLFIGAGDIDSLARELVT